MKLTSSKASDSRVPKALRMGWLYNLPPWVRHLEGSGRSEQALLVVDELVSIANDREVDHFALTGEALRARSLASLGRFDETATLARRVVDDVRTSRGARLLWPFATLLDLTAALRSMKHWPAN